MKSVAIKQFKLDNYIAHLIQQVTGETTDDILTYFQSLAMTVGEDIAKNSKARWIKKDMVLFYKETSIPFRMCIHGGSPEVSVNIYVDVKFPNNQSFHDITDLVSRMVESGLGLAEHEPLPPFVKPVLKAPRCLRNLRLKQQEKLK